MKYNFQVRSYRRSLKKPLVISQCTLRERAGLIVRLENDSGGVGFGEIAPMHFLGSESFDNGKIFCSEISSEVNDDFITSIDPKLPCCQHGMRSAQNMLQQLPLIQREFEVAALFSLANELDPLTHSNYKTFKCKIGSSSFEEEKPAFISFHAKLPQGAKLRLDANGAFSEQEARKWLHFLDTLDDYNIQFLEQPLPKGQELLMAKIAHDYRTPLALDESVVNGDDFQRISESGWPGWVVIKPSLIGDINSFRKRRDQCNMAIVYSSVFETAIGTEANLALAATDTKNDHALGFGTIDYFLEDGLSFHQKGPLIHSGRMTINDFERIWELCEIMK